jgi:pimeloyl-ACP methyl ester carboxylesterase
MEKENTRFGMKIMNMIHLLKASLFTLACVAAVAVYGQTPSAKPAYGYDSTHGHYFEAAKDTRLYYEIYGSGDPVLLLHGGVYGYINEFASFIEELSKTNQVICLATRGHVKSDVGHEPYTYDQRAADAKKLLDHLQIGRVAVIGFSDGGYSAYRMAANYPATVNKLVVIGAGDRPQGTSEGVTYSAAELMKTSSSYFKKRVAAMREPARWDESLQMLNKLYSEAVVSSETFIKIKCPVLLVAGDRDDFSPPASVLKAHQSLTDSRLAVIPGCGHVVFGCNWPAVWDCINPFLQKK